MTKASLLQETCSCACEGRLCLQETVHLLTALFTASIEGSLHPIALWLQRLTVLLFVLLHGQSGLLVLSGICDLLISLSLHTLEGGFLGVQGIKRLCGSGTLLLEFLLRCSLGLFAGADFILEVLLDVAEDRHNAATLARATTIIC